ncbi:hypothetical protein VDG1235_1006 [Verrucomicrobiia bacterium DG1235]|nr:hypothetical protein VDG1235_1006 [Verrucomicrobiae bacterium DG1235]
MAQPPLSRHIRELEELVGAELFRRSSRRVALTAAGEVFLKEAYQLPGILSRAVEGARRAAEGEGSVLRIGFVGALMGDELVEVFESYRRMNSDTQLSLLDLGPAELMEKVEAGELDGAFLGVKPRVLPASISFVEWKVESVQVCLPKGHRLESRKRLRIEDLGGEPLVALSERIAPSYREFLDGLYEKAGVRPEAVRETNGVDAILCMVAAGCGLALLPSSALRRASGRVMSLSLSGKDAKLQELFLYSSAEEGRLGSLLQLLRKFR